MHRRKICVVITARPSYARIRTAMEAIREHPKLELQVITAASAILERFGFPDRVIEAEGFSIDYKLHTMLEGGNLVTAAKSTGLGIIELTSAFQALAPDAVVTIADRFETLSTAVAAAYMNIPLVHIQGGEITGNIDNKVRHAITKLADLHLVASEPARRRVIAMGEEPATVHVTGCPSIDLAARILRDPEIKVDLFAAYKGVGPTFDWHQPYLVVLQHPVTTEPEAAGFQAEETLHAVHQSGIPTFWFWPNIDAGSDATSHAIRAFRERYRPQNIHFFKNLPPDDFLRLVYHSLAIVGNSSVGIRECAFLGVPAVNIGKRQQNRDRAPNVIDIDHDRRQILAAIETVKRQPRPQPSHLYGDGRAGERIADLLATEPLHYEK
ncbi:bifunctional UDP-N-acetylglucosamine 2-epimerase/N-acetylmannosamine kinase [Methylomarinovum tepidoasis]|uniref:Bifunctional UDP-N-acetylglucosamine 2-epimerase/N-acetylmannosamine kinase n=1 Tax=Methylomarinovum tepidoasis TaxID=2840183 RepID=A0AAU9CMX6_9GAMM|nr:UDP-N-acetylglucosamine 2-epimerase [Methylomarinovum sp. IN45]BCX88987.1 bifunctional UDP-N-acetylglucosamine 2-epimerase/N-acetylmannosamine kinase [Methylomarinovum sp. IN45]